MKKILFISFIAFLCISCSTEPQEQILKNFTKELGNPTKTDESIKNDYLYIWENISIDKSNSILDLADKSLNMLPDRKKDIELSSDGKSFFDMRHYETPKFEITVENHYHKENPPTKIDVKLFIKIK